MCQVLSNLCVLQLYNEKETVCSFYRAMAFDNTDIPQANSNYPDKGWIEGLPWLYYLNNATEILRKSNRVDITMSFYQPTTQSSDVSLQRNASLTFYLARYALNGTFTGYQVLKDQLNLCPLNYDDVLNMMKFGAVTESYCEFDLSQLFDFQNLPNEANYFFDLFIMDRNKNLIDVPVLIRNLRNKKGELMNTGTTINDKWRLVRRFFVYDTVSGITLPDGYQKNADTTIVRWASDIKMKITLDPNLKERIYTPYLDITYKESTDRTKKPRVTFIMDYYQEMDYFWKQTLIAFIIFQVIIAFIVAARFYVFLK